LVDRLERQPTALAGEVIGGAVEIIGRGEGMKSAQPLAWICAGLTDAEIRAELEAERFRRAA